MGSFDASRRTAFANKADTCNQQSAANNGAKTALDGKPPLDEELHHRLNREKGPARMSRLRARAIGSSGQTHSPRTEERSSENILWSQRIRCGQEKSVPGV
jgi:hypothetical protein